MFGDVAPILCFLLENSSERSKALRDGNKTDGPVQSFLCSFPLSNSLSFIFVFRVSRGRKLWLVSFDGRLPLVKKNVFHCTRFHIVRPNIFLLSKKQGARKREREQKWNKPTKIVVYCTCTYNDCVLHIQQRRRIAVIASTKSIMGMSITKRTKGFVFLLAFRFSSIFVIIFNGTISK